MSVRSIFMFGLFLALVLIITALWSNNEELASLLLDGNDLQSRILELGLWGPLAIIAIMIVGVVISPIPTAPIAVASGAAFGHFWGTVYVIAGAELGSILAFYLARVLGRKTIQRWLGRPLARGYLGSQNALMAFVFLSRLLPFISFDLISYAAGITNLKFWRFAVATLVGIIPASFLLAHLGNTITNSEVGRIFIALIVFSCFIAISLIISVIRERKNRKGQTLDMGEKPEEKVNL